MTLQILSLELLKFKNAAQFYMKMGLSQEQQTKHNILPLIPPEWLQTQHI